MIVRRTTMFRRAAIATAALILASSCGRESVTPPRERTDVTPHYAKAATTLAVTSASPAFGDQGTTVNVHVFGSGFTAGAQATWLLHGVADPTHVHTNSTTVLSSTELVANVTIATDAQLSFWDVQVALAGGKNGVGSECFEVTSARILGSGTTGGDGTARGLNDLLQVAGGSATSNTSTAWYYDDGSGMVSLGSGDGKAIDPLGAFVVGVNARSTPTAWIRQPNNSWIAQALPQPSVSIGATAFGASRLADQTAIVVGSNTLPTKIGANLNATQPVVWLRASDGTWSYPQIYATPSGFSHADAMDVNPLGLVVGHLGGDQGIVWENSTTYTILDGRAGRINPAGTLIVGQSADNAPVYWWRDGVTHQWHLPATRLPSIAGAACPDGYGLDVNDAGVIVGWSCGTGKNPTVWLLDLSGPSPVLVGTPTQLPGLGVKNSPDLDFATSVTNSAPFVVAGSVHITTAQRVAVEWRLR